MATDATSRLVVVFSFREPGLRRCEGEGTAAYEGCTSTYPEFSSVNLHPRGPLCLQKSLARNGGINGPTGGNVASGNADRVKAGYFPRGNVVSRNAAIGIAGSGKAGIGGSGSGHSASGNTDRCKADSGNAFSRNADSAKAGSTRKGRSSGVHCTAASGGGMGGGNAVLSTGHSGSGVAYTGKSTTAGGGGLLTCPRISDSTTAAAGYNKALGDDKQASPGSDVHASQGDGELAFHGDGKLASPGDGKLAFPCNVELASLGVPGLTSTGAAGLPVQALQDRAGVDTWDATAGADPWEESGATLP
ncbi:UNVERIFIED_CONTAM: hypothetical protein FKN15_003871 [Acipenser sinensis]